ncbi:methyltransferase domain-containing protein [Leptospira vanthielii]|uniref:methyltransferase domain-containing protein n=1 Tax=Leptospira vanthielii TaxID=293085 RepID=UPI00143DB222|nr:methyltransferase domain-containing protein [Leptospira vanthielii]
MTRETREGEGLWVKCDQCGLVINESGVDPDKTVAYYNEDYVKKNSYSKGELLSAKEHFESRLSNIKVIADFLKPYLDKKMRVLELGAATGELLYLLKDNVDYCYANEINQLYSSFIEQELGIPSSSDDYFTKEFKEKFNLIISINTIDHMYGTFDAISKVNNDLLPGGYFYVEVPNDNQALKNFLPEPMRSSFQAFMYQKAHYFSFSFDTLSAALKDRGFEIVKEYSRHDYTINNYLNWYFTGKPQKKFKEALEDTDIHLSDTSFGKEMNSLMKEMNEKFKQIIQNHRFGELICILAKKI